MRASLHPAVVKFLLKETSPESPFRINVPLSPANMSDGLDIIGRLRQKSPILEVESY
jgi:hypothetical protein